MYATSVILRVCQVKGFVFMWPTAGGATQAIARLTAAPYVVVVDAAVCRAYGTCHSDVSSPQLGHVLICWYGGRFRREHTLWLMVVFQPLGSPD